MRLIQTFADTNTGRKRRHNEDSFVCQPPLFAVADGMGGAQAGEVASALAADTLRHGAADIGGDGPAGHITSLIQTANQRVYQRAHDDVAASGMGTTMTAALYLDGGRVVIGHVGDSRAYVLRNGQLDQLTNDHSLVAELVRRGELSPEEAELHPQRSVITRALGTDPSVDVDIFDVQSEPGDVFLLCSDGLTSMVDVATIAEILRANSSSLDAASRALIKAANDRGGEDNITTVLFSVGAEHGEQAATPAAAVEPAQGAGDDEDTLHPEDRVPAITDPGPAPARAQRTMVMSPEAIRAALRGDPAPEQATVPAEPVLADPAPLDPAPLDPAPADPAPVAEPAREPQATPTGPQSAREDPSPPSLAFLEEPRQRPALTRHLLAAVVVVVLLGVIALLLVKGLTR